MDTILCILESEAALTLIAALVGAIWSAVKGSEWFRAHQTARRTEALRAVEAAVQQTYEQYVRVVKDKSPSGKLNSAQRSEARKLAVRTAAQIGADHGLDVIKIIGSERLAEAAVQHAVNRAKF